MLTFPQSYYIAFFRLCNLEEMPADELASTIEFFSQTVTKNLDEGVIVSNPYGGGIICSTIDEALTITFEVLSQCGANVAAGLSRGMIYEVRDVTGANYLGHALNKAARLAYLPEMQGRAVASKEFVHDAIQAKTLLRRDFFGPEVKGKVKRTELIYHLIQDETYIKSEKPLIPISHTTLKAEPMHVLVFDLVKYSEHDELSQRTMVETLAQAVRHAHAWLGRGSITEDVEIQYAPAGDGGAIIFANSLIRSTWTVAEHLQEYSRVHKLSLRLGLDSGQMVRRNNGFPLGPAVLGADRAAQSAGEGVICFTKRFIEHVPEEDREYINSRLNTLLGDESSAQTALSTAPSMSSQKIPTLESFCAELVNFFKNESSKSSDTKIVMKISVLVLHGSDFPHHVRELVLRHLRDAEIDCICPSLNASAYSYVPNIESSISSSTHVLYIASRGENIHKGWAPFATAVAKAKNKIWIPRSIEFQV